MREQDRFPTVKTLDAYLKARGPRAYVSGGLVAASSGDAVQFVAVRDALDEARADELVALASACDELGRAPELLIDLREVRELSVTQYEMLFGLVAIQTVRSGKGRRSALVMSGHPGAAAALGYAFMSKDTLAERVFADGAQALEFLGCADPRGQWAAWEELLHTVAPPAWLERLQQAIRADTHKARVNDCARAIGLSGRALQRLLQESGLTFRDLLAQARVAQAQSLLESGETKLLGVAIEAGFGKVEAMNAAFVRVLGVLPRELVQARPQPVGRRPRS